MKKHNLSYQIHAVAYLLTPLALFVTSYLATIAASGYREGSHTYAAINLIAVLTFLVGFFFAVPFLLFAYHYWRLESRPAKQLPPAEPGIHTLQVRFTSSWWQRALGRGFHNIGVLSWDNAARTLKLVRTNGGQEQVMFDVAFDGVTKVVDDISALIFTVNGTWYYCVPVGDQIEEAAASGLNAVGSAPGEGLATAGLMALQASMLAMAGTPKLLDYMATTSARVYPMRWGATFEGGVLFAFFVIVVGAALTITRVALG